MDNKAYLVLENGAVFEGFSFGADCDSIGELVFTTGVCGYNDTLTDQSNYGQIVLQTFPMVGNYGIIEEAFEGNCAVRGYVVREWCAQPSNFRSNGTLDSFLKKNGIPAIYGVDTRAITRILRKEGVMNAKICKNLPETYTEIKNYKITSAVNAVTCSEIKLYNAQNAQKNVTVIDYGMKNSLIEALTSRGCNVTVVSASASAEDILNAKPDGIVLSSGPADPKKCVFQIEQIKKLFGKCPVLGIGLGHQLLALSQSADTYKLKYGHRGTNQPVKEIGGIRTYITSQNHGYAVAEQSVKCGVISFVNANDQTVEGINYPDNNAFSVQFYPDTCTAVHNTGFVYDRFVAMMEVK